MKKLTALLAAVLMALAGLVAVAPAQAAPTSAQATFPLTGKKFPVRWICVQNNIGATWAIDTIDNWFESGSNTVVLTDLYPGEGDISCANAGFYNSQTLYVSTYNRNDGSCFEVNLPAGAGSTYLSYVVVGMNINASANGCRNTAQKRNNNMSQALGLAFGLNLFTSSSTFQASIMNQWNETIYNYAGTDDRNALYNLY